MKHFSKFFLALIVNFQLSIFNTVAQQRPDIIRSSRIEVTDMLDAQITPRLRQALAPYKASVDSVVAPIVGRSLTAMGPGRPESLLGNWAADAMVWFSSSCDTLPDADFGLMNVGGLRNNMPKGTVRQGDIMLISPFNNWFCICELKGEDVTELMNNIAAVGGEAVSGEVRMRITRDGKLLHATIGGQPIDPQRTYRIATIDYLAEGNDGMSALKRATRVLMTPFLAGDVLMQHVKKHDFIDAKIEGRVEIIENEK